MGRGFCRTLVNVSLTLTALAAWADGQETRVPAFRAVVDSMNHGVAGDAAGRSPVAGAGRAGVVLEPIPAEEALLSIADLEQMGLTNNPTLVQAARNVQALRGKRLQVGLYPNPLLGYVGEEIGDEGRGGQQGIVVNQQIVTAGKLRLNRAVVGHEIERAQQEWEIQRRRVINDVRTAAYQTLAAQRTVALGRQLVRIGEEGREAAQELLKDQEVSRVDVLQARIEANSAKLLLENARNEQQAAWRNLAIVIGIPDMPLTELNDDLAGEPPMLAWDDAVRDLLGSSPELAKAHADVERAKCGLERERAGRVPNFDVEGSVRYSLGGNEPVANVGLVVPFQLFDRNQGNICRAQAELAEAHAEVRRVELALQQRLAAAFRQYANAQQQVQRYSQDILPDAKDSLELVRQGYRQGEFGYLELLTAQRTYFRTNLDYVAALRDLWVASARIEGMLLTGALQAPGP